MNNYKLGNYITTLRENAGYTQAELGSLIDVSDKTVSKWENGQALPRMETFEKLAEVLGTTVEDFISAGKDNVIRVNFLNNFAEVAYLEINDKYVSVAYNETECVELSGSSFTLKISFKMAFDSENGLNNEPDLNFVEKFLSKSLSKVAHSVIKDVLLVECVYRINSIIPESTIEISEGIVNLGDLAFVFQNFLMYYPKIDFGTCELVSAKALNSPDVVKRFNKKAIVSDLGLNIVIAILSYPVRSIYLKYFCKPKVIKKNILNSDKLNEKNSNGKHKGRGCFSALLGFILFLVFEIFIQPVLFVESNQPALISADFTKITFNDEIYVQVSELPQNAEFKGFLGAEYWYDARIDGYSRLDQALQDHKVCVYRTPDGVEYLWLIMDYAENSTDEDGEYLEYNDFENPMVYKKGS